MAVTIFLFSFSYDWWLPSHSVSQSYEKEKKRKNVCHVDLLSNLLVVNLMTKRLGGPEGHKGDPGEFF